jgi:hypothetical protein
MIDEKTIQALSKYGFATVASAIFGWIIYSFMIVPANEERVDAREERKATAKALLESASKTNETNSSLARSYEKMSSAIDAQTSLLKDIRDDTKKFPAVREFSKEP